MSFNYKGFKITRDSFGFTIKKIGKGPLPKMLNGIFNNEKTLKEKIDSYLDNRDK